MATSPPVAYAIRFPAFPPRYGGAVRAFEIVRSLRQLGLDAVLISPGSREEMPPDAPAWLRLFDPAVTSVERVQRKATALRAGLPWSSSPGLSRAFALQLERARAEGRRVIVAGAAGIANQPRSAWGETIVDSHDLELIRAPRMMGQGLAARINVGRARRFEARSLRCASAFLVCSEVERRAALAAESDANVHVLANGVPDDLASFPIPRAPRAYFVGKLDYPPNHEGLHWLAEHVWPAVMAELPDAELLVAGSGTLPASTEAALRSCRGISLLGEIDSIGELQRQAGLALVPIFSGGGTRLKLLEACAGARAVVTTPLGAEGLDLPAFVPVSPSPAGFARETVRRLLDHDLVDREGRLLHEWVADKRWTTLVANVLVPILVGGSQTERP